MASDFQSRPASPSTRHQDSAIRRPQGRGRGVRRTWRRSILFRMLVTVVGPMIIATVMAMSAMYIEGLHQSRQLLTTIVRGQLNAAAGTIDQHRITVLKRV